MNKQLVLAALFATAHGQTTCEDANVAAAKAAKAALDTRKAALETAKTSLAALAKTEADAYAKAKQRYDAQDTLMAPFRVALTSATTNWKKQNDAVTAATTALTALTTPLKTGLDNLTKANAAVAAQAKLVATAKGVAAKFAAAVTEHTTEAATLKSAADAKKTAWDTATLAETAAKKAHTDAKNAKDTATTGTAAKYASSKTTAATAAKQIVTKTDSTDTKFDIELAKWNIYKAKKNEYDQEKLLNTNFVAACNSKCTKAGDPVKALMTASNTKMGNNASTPKTGVYETYDTAKKAWDAALIVLTASQKLAKETAKAEANAKAINDTAAALVLTNSGKEGTATAAVGVAKLAKTTADTALSTVTGQLAQAKTDSTRAGAVLAGLETAMVPLRDAVVIATHMKKIQDDKKAAEDVKKAAGQLNLTDLNNLKTEAQAVVDRAKLKLDFYKGIMDTAKTSNDAAAGNVTANGSAIKKCGTDITAAEAATAVAVAACKGRGYREAQTAMKALEDKNAANTKAATDVAAAYKHDPPTDGTAGTRCEFPVKGADGAQAARPVCKEGLCCGAAQKFLRDGTKLAVETCQATTAVEYTYWPALAKGQTVAPASQTWRFSCISGAQKLAATAAAALAAGYMMA